MKIVKLEDFHVDGGWDTYSFLKITTDEGVTGWSEFNESRRRGMTGVVHGLGAALIGQDPRAVGRIDATLYAQSRPTAGGLTSGTDLALRVVERYFGREVAQTTATYMEYQGKGWIV